jgi:hypothetical protein
VHKNTNNFFIAPLLPPENFKKTEKLITQFPRPFGYLKEKFIFSDGWCPHRIENDPSIRGKICAFVGKFSPKGYWRHFGRLSAKV